MVGRHLRRSMCTIGHCVHRPGCDVSMPMSSDRDRIGAPERLLLMMELLKKTPLETLKTPLPDDERMKDEARYKVPQCGRCQWGMVAKAPVARSPPCGVAFLSCSRRDSTTASRSGAGLCLTVPTGVQPIACMRRPAWTPPPLPGGRLPSVLRKVFVGLQLRRHLRRAADHRKEGGASHRTLAVIWIMPPKQPSGIERGQPLKQLGSWPSVGFENTIHLSSSTENNPSICATNPTPLGAPPPTLSPSESGPAK